MALRLNAEFTPSEDWLVRLSYDQTRDESSPLVGHRPFPGVSNGEPVLRSVYDTFSGATEQPSTAGIGGNNEVDSKGGSLSIEWSATDSLTVRSITAYREDDTKTVIDFDSLEVMDVDGQAIYENEQFSQEFQFLYSTDRVNAVVGVYYLDAKAANVFDVVLAQLAPGGLTGATEAEVNTEAWSVFADLTYDISDRWSLSLGTRYTDDEREADVFRATYLGIGSPLFGNDSAFLLGVTSDYEGKQSYDNVSPRINLKYQFQENAHIYLGYSEGWKAGSFDPRGSNFAFPDVVNGYDEETLGSYELGIKGVWMDDRLSVNTAIFYSDYEDMQIPGSVGIDTNGDGVNDEFVGTVTNAGQAEIKGLELEANLLITQNLSAQFSLSLLDAEIEEWIVDDVDISDMTEIQNTPESQAFLGLNYVIDDAFGGALNLNANASYRDEVTQFELPSPVLDQDSYFLYNASAVWTSADASWQFGLHGKNLGDEEIKTAGYCLGVSGNCPTSLGLEDNVTVFYAPPRTWTASVEYKF